jgi:hypothetical protein
MAKIAKNNRDSVVSDLKSENEFLALAAIEKLKKGGDATYIPDLLSVLSLTNHSSIENAIAQLLFDLKDPEALGVVVDQLDNESFSNIRVLMLSACWHTGLDLSNRLPEFISIASTGTYMECLEVLTVIENWEAIADQEMLENEILRLQAFLSESDTPENDEMIFSIIEVMQTFLVQ